MNRWITLIVLIVMFIGMGIQAHASIFFDNFDTENNGHAALNYNHFTKWTITQGTVDLIGKGSSWDFFPNSNHGLYVDMDGSSNKAGTMLSLNIPLTPGTYCLSYDLAGSQRTGYSPNDSVVASVETGFSTSSHTLNPMDPFITFHDTFTITSNTTVQIQFLATGLEGSGDNVGLLLDNVELECIPEPATILVWSLLGATWVGGLTIVRRRRHAWSPGTRKAIVDMIESGRKSN